MTSQIESSRRPQYTPLEEKQLFESRNKSMETTLLLNIFDFIGTVRTQNNSAFLKKEFNNLKAFWKWK